MWAGPRPNAAGEGYLVFSHISQVVKKKPNAVLRSHFSGLNLFPVCCAGRTKGNLCCSSHPPNLNLLFSSKKTSFCFLRPELRPPVTMATTLAAARSRQVTAPGFIFHRLPLHHCHGVSIPATAGPPSSGARKLDQNITLLRRKAQPGPTAVVPLERAQVSSLRRNIPLPPPPPSAVCRCLFHLRFCGSVYL